MHCETNHLISLKTMDEVISAMDSGYEPIPDHLQHAARRTLNGEESVTISKTSGGKLSRFAAAKRKAKRIKARKAANKARALNARRR